MTKLTDIPSNKKCWVFLNKLAFGDALRCPRCTQTLKLQYVRRYAWCSQCRRKYRPTAHQGSWLYGMKLQPKQLFVLL